MKGSRSNRLWRLFELKITLLILVNTLALALSFYFFVHNEYKEIPVTELKDNAQSIHQYVNELIDEESFQGLNVIEDESQEAYVFLQEQLNQIRKIANIRYLYTAKLNENGEYIYVVDGLNEDVGDFRHIGMPIEKEIIPELERCLQNEFVFSDSMVETEWGVIFIAYFPVTNDYGDVIGAVGMEFDAEHLYQAYTRVQKLLVSISIVLVLFFSAVTVFLLRKAVKGTKVELSRRDKMLRTVNLVSHTLLSTNEKAFRDTVRKSLRLLGESVDADRVYVWKNAIADGKMFISEQSVVWDRSGEDESGVIPDGTLLYDGVLRNWQETLKKRQSINGAVVNFPEIFTGTVISGKAKSILLLPIFLHGKFWGCMGMENFRKEDPFEPIEESIVQSSGLLIASAFQRNKTTEKLIAAKEEAMANTRAKTEFLSRMSHEIRTPMNAIIGMTTVAQKAGDNVARLQYCLNKIDNSSKQLLDIINDVLDMSKIEADKFEIASYEFDFEKMMQRIFNVIQVKLDEKHQSITYECSDIFKRNMISDELRLSQVLLNLLTNAVKFTPDGGRIAIKVDCIHIDQNTSTLHVSVRDNGIGISKENQEKLFDHFEQADGGITRKYGGTGLGLAITKKIITMMGGDIYVDSELGEGSCFIFHIMVGWGSQCLTQFSKEETLQDLRILLVDDAPEFLEYLSTILSGFSLSHSVADSGEKAVEMVEDSLRTGKPYNIVLLDWQLPGENGGAVAKRIKELQNDNVVVIMTSAYDWAAIEGDLTSLGITRFLPKPILPSTLMDTIVTVSENAMISKPAAQPDEGEINWRDKKILLTEDVEVNREILISILEDTGIQIDCAFDGEQAVELFRRQGDQYDLIMMDIQMPRMDGLEATRQIRESGTERSRTVPIIAMTANAFKEDVQGCLNAGMNDHVAKPVDVERLFSVLSEYFDVS